MRGRVSTPPQSAGSLNSPESDSCQVFIPPSDKLEAEMRYFIDRRKQNPKLFNWITSADKILASVKRFWHKAQQTLCSEL
jgi:hypothetical protein